MKTPQSPFVLTKNLTLFYITKGIHLLLMNDYFFEEMYLRSVDDHVQKAHDNKFYFILSIDKKLASNFTF